MSKSRSFRPALRLGACAFVLALACFLSGCGGGNYISPVKPPSGILFTSFKAPLTTDYDNTPVNRNTRLQASQKTSYLQLFFIQLGWGDVSIDKIARQGGIDEVCYADYEFLNVLGIYAEYQINVYGN